MDLLAGYSSSSDDDDDSSSRGADTGNYNENRVESKERSTVDDNTDRLAMRQRVPSAAAAATTAGGGGNYRYASATVGAGAAPAPVSNHSSSERRGRKVLSLTSFLPPQVLARLTKAQALYPSDSDDDNDNDEVNKTNNVIDQNERALARKKSNGSALPALESSRGGLPRDSEGAGGLSTLLQDLRAAKPAVTLGGTAAKANTTSAATATVAPQTLGQAFVTVQSDSKTTRRAEDKPKVVDVHRSFTTASAATAVTGETKPATSSITAVGRALPRLVAAPHRVPVQRNERELPTGVASDNDSVGDPEHGLGAEVFHGTTRSTTDLNSRSNSNVTKKRSRKELERALRHGNLDALQDPSRSYEIDVHSLRQADPAEYAPQDPNPLDASLLVTQNQQHHGIRVGPTLMYDASAGTTATVVVGGGTIVGGDGAATMRTMKGRGKNQIHHVVAAAAQLEMQRARQGSLNPSGATSASTHRANAKAKYGW